MTITSQTREMTATGNGVTTIFPYTFIIPDEDYAYVYTRVIATGDETLVSAINYTLDGIGDPNGGDLTYNPGGVPLPSTHQIILRRVVDLVQEVDVSTQSGFNAAVIETQLDLMVMGMQQIADDVETGEDASESAAAAAISAANAQTSAEAALAAVLGIPTFSVKDFGAIGDGVTDDTASINAAIAYLRANTVQFTPTSKWSPSLTFPPGKYKVTGTIDATLITAQNWTIYGHGATIYGNCTGLPVIDMMGSRYWKIYGLAIHGDVTNTPSYGIQSGRYFNGVASDAGEGVLDSVMFNGKYSVACFYNLSSEVCTYVHCRFWNSNTSATSYCVILDGANKQSITSAFVTVTLPTGTQQSFNEALFLQCDFRKDSGVCIRTRGSYSRHHYLNCYGASSGGSPSAIFLISEPETTILGLWVDLHAEVGSLGLQSVFIIDNDTAAVVGLRNFYFRDHQPQATVNIIDVTGLGANRQVAIDDMDLRIGDPGSSVPIFGATGGATRFLGSGRINWSGTRPLDLTNLQFNGDVVAPSAATITYVAGSYRLFRRPGIEDTVIMKGTTQFLGTQAGTSATDGLSIKGAVGGTGVGEIAAISSGSNASILLTPKGTGRVKDNLTFLASGAPDIILEDQQTSATEGGTFTLGADRTRVLNTEVRDARSECALATNQFTLTAGTYYIEAHAPAYKVDNHQILLYNVTGAAELLRGSSSKSDASDNTSTVSTMDGTFTVAAAQALELRHRSTATQATTGLGKAGGLGVERYARVKLWRLS